MRLVPLLIVALLLAGCGAAEKMERMLEQQKAVSEDIDNALGVESEIGWQWQNGVLTQMTVALPAREVDGATVYELTQIIEPIVDKHFDTKPEVLFVTLWVSYE